MRSELHPSVLVTGGAGYIGSHVVKQLIDGGESVIVLDNLSNGSRKALPDQVEFHKGDVLDFSLLNSIICARKVKSVIHLAAAMNVAESVSNPSKYYRNNTGATANLLHCAAVNGVTDFIFSSTAAVYGMPDEGICREDSPTTPINPYGASKLMSEHMLRDQCRASRMRSVILRYFNVAGAEATGTIGQRGKASHHITKIACEVAVGKRDQMEVFGTDYPTADGTCVRDYIHVEDLATAHMAALRYVRNNGNSTTLNCGYGHGFSVREVIHAVERAAGKTLSVKESERRPGDPPILIAAADKIGDALQWHPSFDDLAIIASSALAWERKLQCE